MPGGSAPSIQLIMSELILSLRRPSVQPPRGFFRVYVTKISPVELNKEADLPRQIGEEQPVCDHAEVAGK